MEQNERISEMDALLFALSFEVVLLQMKILEGSTKLRLADWRPANKIEKLQEIKLEKDRSLVNDVIRRTLIEVAETGRWQAITNAVDLLKQSECDVESLRVTNQHLRTTRKTLASELDAKRNQWALELHNADQKVPVLRDKMSDDLHNANTRLCYAEKWLFARYESLELKLDVPRAPPPRTDHEQRVHEELLKAYELQIEEHEKSLEYWRHRYDIDIAEISSRSQKKLEQLLIATSKRTELQKLYDLHEGEMRGWLTFKQERAARLEREEKLRQSAMRIQAWWRGVMVRRALGQFKYLKNVKGKGKKK
ncbi:IQ domain-containing protein G-like [Spodoptera litura]|uniref:Dynein regulatory complex protein 9 n=1 Tax=Spodoptera litura TaxID=69820 RepID=A0A9J7EA16_SPOLT|nr:IQ domain-containing protein G-like [Spodoptera litura]